MIIFHSREEDVDRPTSPEPIVHDDNILSTVDLVAGGVAAVGMNLDTGRFAILTNCRYKPGVDACGLSRGTVLRDILKHEEPADEKYQGFFHLYYGNVFVPSSEIQYVTNIDGSLTSTRISASIIVRMNEHPTTERFWRKKRILETALSNSFGRLKELDSPSQVIEWFTGVFASAQRELDLTAAIDDSPDDLSWSQFPADAENFSQSRIIIDPFLIGKFRFGTISQTCIIAMEGKAMYYYRNLINPDDRDWLCREIHSP